MFDYNVSFVPRSDNDKIMEGEYVKVTEVGDEYIVSTGERNVIIKYQTPQIVIGGIPNPKENGGRFYRMSYELSTTEGGNYYRNHINNNVQSCNWHTSGGTIRFRTNAEYVILIAGLQKVTSAGARNAGRGVCGFDAYTGTGTDKVYVGGRMQTFSNAPSVVENVKLPEGFKEVQINMPLYSGIKTLTLGFPKDALIAAPLERDFDKPILFYGSSITQGACASRPGTAFPNMVCRMLNADCRNLGYSSGAHGEDEMIEYIAKEDMCAFVMDYDHNANVVRLADSHYKLYRAVRDAHPDIPIVMVSRTIFTPELANTPADEDQRRIDIITDTYNKAKENGDENVYFVNGSKDIYPLQSELPDLLSGDMRHPNDTGMFFIGLAVYKVLAPALEAKKK